MIKDAIQRFAGNHEHHILAFVHLKHGPFDALPSVEIAVLFVPAHQEFVTHPGRLVNDGLTGQAIARVCTAVCCGSSIFDGFGQKGVFLLLARPIYTADHQQIGAGTACVLFPVDRFSGQHTADGLRDNPAVFLIAQLIGLLQVFQVAFRTVYVNRQRACLQLVGIH